MVSRANTPRGGTKPYLDPLARHNQPHAADGKPRHQKLKHGPNKRKNRRRRLPKVPSGGLDLLPPLIQLRRQRSKPRTMGCRREQLRPPRLYKLHARPHHRREPRRASRPACARRSRWEEGQTRRPEASAHGKPTQQPCPLLVINLFPHRAAQKILYRPQDLRLNARRSPGRRPQLSRGLGNGSGGGKCWPTGTSAAPTCPQ